MGLFGLNGVNVGLAVMMSIFGRKPFFYLLRGDRLATTRRVRKRGLEGGAKVARVWGYERVLRMQVARGVLVFTQGSELADRYNKREGTNVHALNAAIDEGIVLSDAQLRVSIKKRICGRLIYVGRLSPEKGLITLLEGFRLARLARQNLELHIVGSGPLRDELARKIEELGLSECTVLHGFVPMGPSLLRLYDMCDLVVITSYTEGLPRALVEAMGRGLGVVATRVGSIPDVVKEGEIGRLVEPDDPSGFAEAVHDVIGKLEADYERIAFAAKKEALRFVFQNKGLEMKRIVDRYLTGPRFVHQRR